MKKAAVLACFAVAATVISFVPTGIAEQSSYSEIERGRYLVTAGDCNACHTAESGKPFAGSRPIPTPFGTIYSTNITPDVETGIGSWTEEDFYRALHEGIGRNGRHLYPAFPYPWYTQLTRDDVDAIRAYLNTLAPVHNENRTPQLPWPLTVRSGLALWNALFFEKGTYRSHPDKSAEWNRGAYLVEGLGHCSSCHSPKNFAGALKDGKHFTGGYGEHWYAVNVTNDVGQGLGTWTIDDVVEYLKTGSNTKAAAAGPMAEVIRNSTQHLTQQDLHAMAVYLKDLPAKASPGDAGKPPSDVLARGEGVYLDQCTGCHMERGQGLPGVFPPLKGSALVQADDPQTLVRMILEGGHTVATRDKPTGLAMPAFGWKLTDRDIADVASYVRNAWGNHAGAVSQHKVSDARQVVNAAGL